MIEACQACLHVVISVSVMLFIILNIGLRTVQRIFDSLRSNNDGTARAYRPTNDTLDRSRE